MNVNRNEQIFRLEGRTYTPDACRALASDYRFQQGTTPAASPLMADLFEFLGQWFNDSPTLTVQTSGSTGTPKQLTVRKDRMMQSARLTCEFLGLQAGDDALLCMPMQYIAGKMMVVRALVAGLNLWVRTPSGHPLSDEASAGADIPFRFAAMIPLQVYNTLRVPQEKQRLEQIGALIIGGGAIDASLEEELRKLPGAVYSTYGMTETLSHIALRRLNGPDASLHYHPFASVQLSLSAEDTLIIHAPLVCDEILVTNDVARLHADGSFSIIGRKDNVINTGGVKVQMEEVENELRSFLHAPFAVTSVPDARLGEAVVLLLEQQDTPDTAIFEELPKYHRPRHIFHVSQLPMTGSGKIDRAACKALAQTLLAITH